MNITDLINYYKHKGINEVILTQDSVSFIQDKNFISHKIVTDTRSATFYAMGKAQTLQSPIILIVSSESITSCYTGLMESWFQNLPIIVISLDDGNTDYSYLDRCIRSKKIIHNGTNWNEFKFDESINTSGPSLIILKKEKGQNIQSDIEIKDISGIISFLPQSAKVFYSNLFKICTFSHDHEKYYKIENKNKYCTISKYLGYLNGYEKEAYLIIPLDWVKYDMNIFTTRYLNKYFKVILIQNHYDKDFEITQWIKYNSIQIYKYKNKQDSLLSSFILDPKPSIIIIKQ